MMRRIRRVRLSVLLTLFALASWLAGCSGVLPAGSGTVVQENVAPPATGISAQPQDDRPFVPAELVSALIREAGERSFSLAWKEGETSGRAGRSRNGDRYFLPEPGQGFVQKGLRSWVVETDPKGGLAWSDPYAGGILQLPFLAKMQSHPETWGVEPIIAGVKSLRRETAEADTELWVAELPDSGVDVPWHGTARSIREFQVLVKKAGSSYLPMLWEAKSVIDGRPVSLEAKYEWDETTIPAHPAQPTTDRELGLFHVWLGQHRGDIEPFLFAPTEQKKDADGSAWSVQDGKAIKYDAEEKVIELRQTTGSLVNGLSVGDGSAAVVRFLGPVADPNQSVLVYRFPSGNRLEVRLQEGKVREFRAIGVGQP